MAKPISKAKMDRDMAMYQSALNFIRTEIGHLMPNSRFIPGDPDGQMHLSIGDEDSQIAARVTLEKYGEFADLWNNMGDLQVFIHFPDDDKASEAINFYNRLPKRMKNYKPKP